MLFLTLSRAARSSMPRAAAAATALASGLASLSPSCTGESEMRAFVKTAGGTDGQYNELKAVGLGGSPTAYGKRICHIHFEYDLTRLADRLYMLCLKPDKKNL